MDLHDSTAVAAGAPGRTLRWDDSRWLMLAAALLLFVSLGARELWTHEGRWAEICREMDQSGDWLHPREFGEASYDKPPLSYWLILAASTFTGGLNEWALRLPSAFAGLLLVWITVRLGRRLFDGPTGLLAGWLLVSAPFFAFWSRTAGAEMLNVAGIAGAVLWHLEKREKPSFLNYFLFFSILAVTSMTKGLVGAAIPLILVSVDFAFGSGWEKRIRASIVPAGLLAVLLYLSPVFLAELQTPGGASASLGALLHESVGRYVRAFDHVEPFHHYFQYLGFYLLPWTPCFVMAAWRLGRGWSRSTPAAKWLGLATAAIFVFFQCSSSRRNYYILPILPFALLMAASWLRSVASAPARRWTMGLVSAGAIGAFAWFAVALPAIESEGSKRILGHEVRESASVRSPWSDWRVILVNLPPSYAFYIGSERETRRCDVEIAADLFTHDRRTIIVANRAAVAELLKRLPRTTLIHERPARPIYWNKETTRTWEGVALLPS